MMNGLKNVIRQKKRMIKSFVWNLQVRRVRSLKKNVCKAKEIVLKDVNILIVAPHPDDELIGCFGVIEHKRCKVDIYYTGLTGYDVSDENKTIRINELKNLCDHYKINLVSDISGEQIKFIEQISSNKYQYIFLPTYIDWHWEHRSTCIQLLKILLDQGYMGDLVWYMVSVPIPINVVNYYNVVESNKWSIFKQFYRSQHHMPIDRFKAVETAYINGKHIEPYLLFDYKRLNKLYDSLSNLDISSYNMMEGIINNIPKIMSESEYAYKKLFEEMNRYETL